MSIRPVAGKLVQNFPGRYTGDDIFVIATVKLKLFHFFALICMRILEVFLADKMRNI